MVVERICFEIVSIVPSVLHSHVARSRPLFRGVKARAVLAQALTHCPQGSHWLRSRICCTRHVVPTRQLWQPLVLDIVMVYMNVPRR